VRLWTTAGVVPSIPQGGWELSPCSHGPPKNSPHPHSIIHRKTVRSTAMPERPGPASSNSIGLPQGELYRGGRIGKYEILTQLSVGGMAELFLAFTSGPGGFRKFVLNAFRHHGQRDNTTDSTP
jgi:hypothetical protein